MLNNLVEITPRSLTTTRWGTVRGRKRMDGNVYILVYRVTNKKSINKESHRRGGSTAAKPNVLPTGRTKKDHIWEAAMFDRVYLGHSWRTIAKNFDRNDHQSLRMGVLRYIRKITLKELS